MVTEEYILENLCCANCADKIEKTLGNQAGVKNVELNFVTKTLTLEVHEHQKNNLRLQQIIHAIEPDVKVVRKSIATSGKKSPLPLSLYTTGLAVLVCGIAVLYQSESTFKLGLFISAYMLSSWKVLYKAVVRLAKGDYLDEHFLMSIATLGAIYLGEYTEAIAVMVLYEIGQYLENLAVDKSRRSIHGLLDLKPDKVHLLRNEVQEDTDIQEIFINDRIVVLPGERVPLDGLLESGESSLDTSALTGEAMPLAVSSGDTILSGSMNLTGKIILKVTSSDAESTVSRIMNLVEKASQRKSHTEKFITSFARIYTPVVVLLALFILLIPSVILNQPLAIWLKRALIFLIVSCPCALVISIPLTNYAAIGAAARKGILFKGSNFLDALARLKTFVYDKTGTLTTGKLSVSAVIPLRQVDAGEVQTAALICEANSTHPIALAVKNAWQEQSITDTALMMTEVHGKGIKAQLPGTTYFAGSRLFMTEQGVRNLPEEPSETCIFLAKDKECLGVITFKDEVKPGMAQVIKQLRKLGISNHMMLTGDHAVQAKQVSDQLGLNHFDARLLPDEKLLRMEFIDTTFPGPTGFVGDGLNDAPVISGAEIGIAMGCLGNQAAIEAADVVLMQDKPEQLLQAVQLAKRTRIILWQNIFIALGIKIVVMILGTLGLATIWEAVSADVGVTVLCVMNAVRILK